MLGKFVENVQEYDESVPEIIRSVKVHEFPLIVIFPKDSTAGEMILHLIRNPPRLQYMHLQHRIFLATTSNPASEPLLATLKSLD